MNILAVIKHIVDRLEKKRYLCLSFHTCFTVNLDHNAVQFIKTYQSTSTRQNRSTHPNPIQYMDDYKSKQKAVIAKPLHSVHMYS